MPANQYLQYVHSFRGFAILNIVAIHAFAIAIVIPQDWSPDRTAPLFVLNEVLFHDSTVYFAVISGLLFSSVLRSRGYRRFFASKILYVLLPYVFCTVAFSFVRFSRLDTGVLAFPVSVSDYLNSILPNLMKGEAQFTFWYIPVLLVIFVLTPLLARLVEAKSYSAIMVWIVMSLPLIYSRPPFEPGTSQITTGSIIYFAGAYTVGLYLGDNLEERLESILKYRWLILATAVFASGLLAILHFEEINRFGNYSLRESLYYLQKLCIGSLVLVWLKSRFENQPRWLSAFADAAFSIYFLHIFFILLLAHFLWDFLHVASLQPWSIYLTGSIYFIFSLSLSLLVVKSLQACIGRYSRLLIGS